MLGHEGPEALTGAVIEDGAQGSFVGDATAGEPGESDVVGFDGSERGQGSFYTLGCSESRAADFSVTPQRQPECRPYFGTHPAGMVGLDGMEPVMIECTVVL